MFGLFKAVGSFLGLVNNNQTASELAKDISTGLDKSFYTKQEKTQDKLAATAMATEAWLRMVEMMKSSEAYRSITRRVISLGFISNIMAFINYCILIESANAFGWIKLPLVNAYKLGDDTYLQLTSITVTTLKIAGAFNLGWALSTIIVFYFGPQLAQILIGRKNK